MQCPKYKRVLIKLSGEFLAGEKGYGLSPEKLKFVCQEIKAIKELGLEIAIVVGGGNIWRGEGGGGRSSDRAFYGENFC